MFTIQRLQQALQPSRTFATQFVPLRIMAKRQRATLKSSAEQSGVETGPALKASTPKKQRIWEAADHGHDTRVKASKIAKKLQEMYPNPPIPLDHGNNYQLLVAVMLSAQSTDKKVNEVTPALFARAPDAKAMAGVPVDEIQQYVRLVGLAPTKAKNIAKMSELLLERHGGKVPSTFQELEALLSAACGRMMSKEGAAFNSNLKYRAQPGVGHKTASVVMSQAFGVPAFPVDTHIHRLAQRWGLTNGSCVEQTEADLKALFPEESWNDLHLQIIFFGREYCPAIKHDPAECPICSWAAVAPYDRAGTSPRKAGSPLKGASASRKRVSKGKAMKVAIEIANGAPGTGEEAGGKAQVEKTVEITVVEKRRTRQSTKAAAADA